MTTKDTGKSNSKTTGRTTGKEFHILEILAQTLLKYKEEGGEFDFYDLPEGNDVLIILRDVYFCPNHPPEKAVFAPAGELCNACKAAQPTHILTVKKNGAEKEGSDEEQL